MSGPLQVPAVLQWLWQATWKASLLCLVVWTIQTLLRRKLPAQWSFALWWLVILRLLLPAGPSTPWSAFNLFSAKSNPLRSIELGEQPLFVAITRSLTATGLPTDIGSPRSTAAGLTGHRFYLVLAWGWALGAGISALRLGLANWRLNCLLRRGRTVADADVLEALQESARLFRLRQTPRLVSTSQFDSPAVVGFFRPTLMLPDRLPTLLSRAELRHVFLHEMAHIRRRDLALNWLLCALETAHWFNPVLRYSFQRIRADRELACDALALSRMQPGESHSYGRTILKLLESLTVPAVTPGLVGLLEEKKLIKRRIDMIANKPSSRNSVLAAALLAGLGLFTLTDAQIADPVASARPAAGGQLQAEAASATARDRTRDLCVNNLKQLGVAIRVWANDHDDRLPPNLISLKNELPIYGWNVLQCPGDKSHQVTNWAQVKSGEASYQFYLKGLTGQENPQTAIAECPVHHNLLLLDGSVQVLGEHSVLDPKFRQAMEEQKGFSP